MFSEKNQKDKDHLRIQFKDLYLFIDNEYRYSTGVKKLKFYERYRDIIESNNDYNKVSKNQWVNDLLEYFDDRLLTKEALYK